MLDNLSLLAMHAALAWLLLQFMRRPDPEDPVRRRGLKRRFGADQG